ncbi:MAG: DUF3108 domain-containing protein [Undibacterium sp.]|nr:DUF3108 domain-containing protein [Undibacterium sp.]
MAAPSDKQPEPIKKNRPPSHPKPSRPAIATPPPKEVASVPEPTPQNKEINELSNTTESAATSVADTSAMEPEGLPDAEFGLRLPDSIEMQLEVSQTKLGANPINGVGHLSWETDQQNYRISIEVGLNLLFTTFKLYSLTSEGSINDFGLAPRLTSETRRGRAETAIHFNHSDKTILFSSSNQVLHMEDGAQDMASVLLQLSSIGNANATQLGVGKEIIIQVAEGRDATPFIFQVIGEEEIDSPLSGKTEKLITVHVSRPPRPGSYNSALDIWLAPSHAWYPVQIRNTESNGTVTLQRVTRLSSKLNSTLGSKLSSTLGSN